MRNFFSFILLFVLSFICGAWKVSSKSSSSSFPSSSEISSSEIWIAVWDGWVVLSLWGRSLAEGALAEEGFRPGGPMMR
ncbi:hypothetical protein E6O75_ATG10416 [Venturia nashicola]|uniref:Secreted protein n=1 Tax=Venturia nashicola TaxID=86259 RepID=A0A4Z1NTA9_9PEZI|nr:hypothetical protein E6O75_ATG10416 [Venturia nashicola]